MHTINFGTIIKVIRKLKHLFFFQYRRILFYYKFNKIYNLNGIDFKNTCIILKKIKCPTPKFRNVIKQFRKLNIVSFFPLSSRKVEAQNFQLVKKTKECINNKTL